MVTVWMAVEGCASQLLPWRLGCGGTEEVRLDYIILDT
jgi:hypothetical protein